jgi:hypothetical protein
MAWERGSDVDESILRDLKHSKVFKTHSSANPPGVTLVGGWERISQIEEKHPPLGWHLAIGLARGPTSLELGLKVLHIFKHPHGLS